MMVQAHSCAETNGNRTRPRPRFKSTSMHDPMHKTHIQTHKYTHLYIMRTYIWESSHNSGLSATLPIKVSAHDKVWRVIIVCRNERKSRHARLCCLVGGCNCGIATDALHLPVKPSIKTCIVFCFLCLCLGVRACKCAWAGV